MCICWRTSTRLSAWTLGRAAPSGAVILPRNQPALDMYAHPGIVNGRGNVLGMMPHPERAGDADLPGGTDVLLLWRSAIEAGVAAVG